MTPFISVTMGVYNGEKYLVKAIESILNQTFTDFEFIIINDGSTDGTSAILQRYKQLDPRIKVYYQDNSGLAIALNRGLELAQGKYFATMDADDICLPERFAKVFTFMEANPEVGICGGWHKTIGQYSYVEKYPTDNATLRCRLLFTTAFSQPTVLMRREFLVKANLSYDPAHKYCEDYGLWVKASKHFPLANLAEVLMLHRTHPNQVTQSCSNDQQAAAKHIRLAQLATLGIQPTAPEADLHESIRLLTFPVTKDYIQQGHNWLLKLKKANAKVLTYNELALANILGQRWFYFCSAATELGVWTWKTFWQSPLSKAADLSWRDKLKFAVKCGIKRRSQF